MSEMISAFPKKACLWGGRGDNVAVKVFVIVRASIGLAGVYEPARPFVASKTGINAY